MMPPLLNNSDPPAALRNAQLRPQWGLIADGDGHKHPHQGIETSIQENLLKHRRASRSPPPQRPHLQCRTRRRTAVHPRHHSLNSPKAYPRYNGAIEKGLQELKKNLKAHFPVPEEWSLYRSGPSSWRASFGNFIIG